MKLGYVIRYVQDVAASVAFYEAAFGLTRRFVHESGAYAEMETGNTALAFASEALPVGAGVEFRPTRVGGAPPACEVGLVTADVEAAFRHAISMGAVAVQPPREKAWGQMVAYVRDHDGALVELCTPVVA